MEEGDPTKKKEKRTSSGSKGEKRRSMPSISLSNTKSIIAGRFGEAFRRFETNNETNRDATALDRESILTPITGSEATDGRSDDGQVIEEVEDTPEVRRELERRRLSQEERRVAEGAAAYKKQVAEQGGETNKNRGREGTRAAMIQNKVQSLLDESNKASPTKPPDGYGHFAYAAAPGGNGVAAALSLTSPTLSTRFPLASITKGPAQVDNVSRKYVNSFYLCYQCQRRTERLSTKCSSQTTGIAHWWCCRNRQRGRERGWHHKPPKTRTNLSGGRRRLGSELQ